MSGRIQWTEELINRAVELVKEHGSIHKAEEILSKELGRTVTNNMLRAAFKTRDIDYRKIAYPFLVEKAKKSRVVDPTHLSDDEATQKIAELIAEAATELKLAPQDLTWADFKNFAEYHWGSDVQSLITPRHITRVGGYANIRDAFYPPLATKFSVEKQELKEKAQLHRSVSLLETVNAAFLRQLEEVAITSFADKIVPSKYALNVKHAEIEREVNAVLSDLHFHALLDGRESAMKYGPQEEARRMAAIAVQIAEWKPQYRKNTKLRLLCLGDWIQNQLHDLRDGAPLAEQACAAIHYGASLVSFVSQYYPEIDVFCNPGNHGRNLARHPTRAVVQKWDSIETIVYYGIKAACRNLPNVKFHIPRTPYVTWDSFGQKGYGTHGDSVVNVGFPGKAIPTGSIENQINRMNAALADAAEYKVVAVGHVHTASLTHLSNGSTLITNGPLIPSDQYAESICIPEANCGQYLWESVPGHIVGDARFCRVDSNTDKDASLDRVVTPFHDF